MILSPSHKELLVKLVVNPINENYSIKQSFLL